MTDDLPQVPAWCRVVVFKPRIDPPRMRKKTGSAKRPVEIDGVSYESIAAAAKALGKSYPSLKKKLARERGETPY